MRFWKGRRPPSIAISFGLPLAFLTPLSRGLRWGSLASQTFFGFAQTASLQGLGLSS